MELTKQQQESQESTLEKDSVVTSQPTSSMGLFSSESQDEGNVPNFEDVAMNAPVSLNVMYSGIPMAKGLAEFLTDPNQQNIAQVHKSCGKVDETEDT